MTDITPAPEAVAEMVERLHDRCGPAQYDPLAAKAADMLEALAADLAAQKARADAADAETNKVRRFLKISRDEGGEALTRAAAAEAKVARLEAALDVDPWFLGWGAWQYHVRKARAAIAEVQG